MRLFPILAILVTALTAAPAQLPAEEPLPFDGIDLTYLGLERVTNFRELAVKNPKKDALVVVRFSFSWTADVRRLLIKDSDIALYEARGKKRRPALKFVQALAEPGETKRTIEIPFRVDADARLTTLSLGKSVLKIEPPPEKAEGGSTSR
jgi:hypothetical protein